MAATKVNKPYEELARRYYIVIAAVTARSRYIIYLLLGAWSQSGRILAKDSLGNIKLIATLSDDRISHI